MKRMALARRLSQGFFLLTFIYILWSTTYPLTGILPPDLFFKADPLIIIMTSVSERLILPGISFSLYMIALTLLVGRFFCGWVCPLGTAIDITGALNKKRRAPGDKQNAILRKVKFYILGIFFVFAILGKQVAWIFDPLVIAARFISLNLIPALTLTINSFFMALIKYMNIDGYARDLYHSLKPTILGVKVAYFAHSLAILLFFAAVCVTAVAIRRFWCRALCPLGALYGLLGRFAPLKRTLGECLSCGKCKSACRTGAIKDDASYVQGECILCMDCIYDCPSHITHFKFAKFQRSAQKTPAPREINQPKMSRKNFLFALSSSTLLLGAKFKPGYDRGNPVIMRPPAALEEKDFVNRCIRCGNCMKVCITNGLHPVMLQAGIEGIWTPQLLPEIGYCEYHCTLCGRTCPTGAIPALKQEQKLKVKLGVAQIDRSICLPWAAGKECIVCQEHCPVSEKAIKLDTYSGGPARPYIDADLCVGCGICQHKCPVRPARAVRVSPKNAERTKLKGVF